MLVLSVFFCYYKSNMNSNKRTKIVATIGPSSEDIEILKKMVLSGVNVFRFNTKHNEISWHNERIKRAQRAANEVKEHIAILIDLQGPEIRIETKNEKELRVEKGNLIAIGKDFEAEDIVLAIDNKTVFNSLKKDDILFIDDGFIELKVTTKNRDRIIAKVIEGGIIKNKKSLNLPDKKLKLTSLIENDLKSLDMIAKEKIDYVALSFVRNKKDIQALRREMEKRDIKAEIVSKIENRESITNIEEIIDNSDAIMIARGDLGIEVPIEELAYLQKEIIEKCREARKPVIVATQMLYSMTNNPRPTRAEATDIANAVFNGTDAVMLSEETAVGRYPVRVVETMSKIINFNEEKTNFSTFNTLLKNTTELTANSVFSMLNKSIMMGKVIIFTESGYMARVLSSFRPKAKILAITENKKTAEKLALSYGVTSEFVTFSLASPKSIRLIVNKLKKEKTINSGKKLIIVSGKHKGRKDIVNSFSIVNV